MSRSLAWWTHMSRQLQGCARGEGSVQDALTELRDELGYDAALLVTTDPSDQSTQQALNMGYPTQVAEYLRGHYIDACPGYAWARNVQSPTRFVDLPFDFRLSPSFLGVLGPAGFDEGITLPFLVPFSGQHGFLAMSSRHCRPLDEDSRLALALLGTAIGAINQPESSFGVDWQPATSLIRVDRTAVRPITPEPIPAFLSSSDLVTLAGRISASHPSFGFRMHAGDGRWWRLNLYGARDVSGQQCVIVRVGPTPNQRSLTSRQMDVAGAVRAGLDNNEIASLFRISLRTVKTHLEQVLQNLAVANRTGLAAIAWAEDLSTLSVELMLAARPSVF